MTKQEAIHEMLRIVRSGVGVLVSNDEFCPGFPTIHQVGCGERHRFHTVDEVKHAGFGFFHAHDPDISFDAGMAMKNAEEDGKWLFGWTRLRGSPEALAQLGYDLKDVETMLEGLVD